MSFCCQGNHISHKVAACDRTERFLITYEWICRYERHRNTKQIWTGLGNLEESTTMLPVFFLPKHYISFHRKGEEEHVIPIQTSMILVILLSCTYSLPLRLKKNPWWWQMKFQALSWLLTFWEIALIKVFCKKAVYMCYSSVSIRQPFRQRCRCAAS